MINTIRNFLKEFKDKGKNTTPSYTLFGSFYLTLILLPSFFFNFDTKSCEFFNLDLFLRFFSAFLCLILVTRHRLPKVFDRYIKFFYYFTVWYSIVFLPIIIALLNTDSVLYVANFFICLIVLFALESVFFSIFSLLFGGVATFIFYNFFLKGISLDLLIDNKYIFLYYFILTLFINFFIIKKNKNKENILSSRARLLEMILTNDAINAQKSMSLPLREENQFNSEFALLSGKEKLHEIIKNYERKNIKEDLIALEEILEIESRTKLYYSLSAKKYSMKEFLRKSKETLNLAGGSDVAVNIYSKQEKIRCDETSILKMFYKIANDHCDKIAHENSGDDTDLILSIFDTKILYESDEEKTDKKLFSRTIDGVCIMLSEKDCLEESSLVKSVYIKKLTDLESIMIAKNEEFDFDDIYRGIDAHYGILENHSDVNYLNWVCIIPADVYEIRPEGLDLEEPINEKYNWPAALALEKEFLEILKRNSSGINLSKIEYAISLIKKYHFHQVRKSGDPYYMHPINVAIIALQILKDKETRIHEALAENKENLILGALLHDILEDTTYSKKAIARNFGVKIQNIVLEVTKIDQSKRSAMLTNEQAFQNLINKEPISLCIKIADRFHNLVTIDGHSNIEKRKAIAQETLAFFIPPAAKFGLKLKDDLEKMSNYILKNGKIEGYK